MTNEKHLCHTTRCQVPVPPAMLMCKEHWYMVPKRLRDQVWRTYVPGQEIRKDPSKRYLIATQEAIRAVDREVERKRGSRVQQELF